MREMKIYVHGGVTVDNIPDHIQVRVFDDSTQYLLPENRRDEDYSIAVSWCVADVKNAAKERGIAISTKQAIRVLDSLEQNHNAQLGINWATIDSCLDKSRSRL